MKKVYVIPTILVVQLNVKHHLLEATNMSSGGSTSGFDVKGVSDKYGIWDEEW